MRNDCQVSSDGFHSNMRSFRRKAISLIAAHWVMALGSFMFVSPCSVSYRGWGLAIIPDLIGLAVLDRRLRCAKRHTEDGRYVVWLVMNLTIYLVIASIFAFESL